MPTLDLGKNDEDDLLGVNATMLPAPTSWLAPPNALGGASPVPNVSKEAAQGAPPPQIAPVVAPPVNPISMGTEGAAKPQAQVPPAAQAPSAQAPRPPTLAEIDANIAKVTGAPGSTVHWGGDQTPESMTPQAVKQYTEQEARRLGINPELAKAVASVESSFGQAYYGDKDENGNPTSFGPFQLHYTGKGAMGDNFTRDTGLDARNPATWKQQITYALTQARDKGWSPWANTMKKLGYNEKTGEFRASQVAQGGGGNLGQGGISQSQGGQTGVAPPDLSGLFRLALLQAAFPRHEFVPIQYDPYKVLQAEHIG